MGIEVNGERIDTIKFDDDKTNLKRTEQVVQKLLNKKKKKKYFFLAAVVALSNK